MISGYVDVTGAIRAWKLNETLAEQLGNSSDDLALGVGGSLQSKTRWVDFAPGLTGFGFDQYTSIVADSSALRAAPNAITIMIVFIARQRDSSYSEQPLVELGDLSGVGANQLIWGIYLGAQQNVLVRAHGVAISYEEVASAEAVLFGAPNLLFITRDADNVITGVLNGQTLDFGGGSLNLSPDGSAAQFRIGGLGATAIVPQVAVFPGVPDIEALTDDFFLPPTAITLTLQPVAAGKDGGRIFRFPGTVIEPGQYRVYLSPSTDEVGTMAYPVARGQRDIVSVDASGDLEFTVPPLAEGTYVLQILPALADLSSYVQEDFLEILPVMRQSRTYSLRKRFFRGMLVGPTGLAEETD